MGRTGNPASSQRAMLVLESLGVEVDVLMRQSCLERSNKEGGGEAGLLDILRAEETMYTIDEVHGLCEERLSSHFFCQLVFELAISYILLVSSHHPMGNCALDLCNCDGVNMSTLRRRRRLKNCTLRVQI